MVHQLEVSSPLIEAAMSYLNENHEESEAVFGVLRFILQNGISLTSFELKVVRHF